MNIKKSLKSVAQRCWTFNADVEETLTRAIDDTNFYLEICGLKAR